MLPYEGQAKIEHRVPPANRWADGEAEPDTRTLPALLYQLQAGRLGRMATTSKVCVQQCRAGLDGEKPLLCYVRLQPVIHMGCRYRGTRRRGPSGSRASYNNQGS